MRPAVHGQFVPPAGRLADQFGMAYDALAQDEERGTHQQFVQGVEEERGGGRVGAVVEGEGDVTGVPDPREPGEAAAPQPRQPGGGRDDVGGGRGGDRGGDREGDGGQGGGRAEGRRRERRAPDGDGGGPAAHALSASLSWCAAVVARPRTRSARWRAPARGCPRR